MNSASDWIKPPQNPMKWRNKCRDRKHYLVYALLNGLMVWPFLRRPWMCGRWSACWMAAFCLNARNNWESSRACNFRYPIEYPSAWQWTEHFQRDDYPNFNPTPIWTRFKDVEAIKKTVTSTLKCIPKKGSFQNFCSWVQKCVTTDRRYFEIMLIDMYFI